MDSLLTKLSELRTQVAVLIVLGIISFGNTINHEYAFDDSIVLQKNEYVQEGLSGISKIFSSDAYESYYRQMNAEQELSGGRYRPLSIATFAIEQELFGDNATPKHAVNILLYLVLVILMLSFLRLSFFSEKPLLAFGITLVFLIHPLHTEVVANIKSRDEIMSLLFLFATLNHVVRYLKTQKMVHIGLSAAFFFLALLSKEYGVSLLFLVPIMIYLLPQQRKKIILPTAVLGGVFALYFVIRVSIVGMNSVESTEILNNPFLNASGAEAFATKIAVLGKYLKLLFVPWPLSYDYSYNEIPIVGIGNPGFLISALIYLGITAGAFYSLWKRHIISFGLFFFLLNLGLVSNLIFNIGAPLGERLAFHASFGFLVALAILLQAGLKKWKTEATTKTMLATGIVAVAILAFTPMTILRNADWKNERTLFLADVESAPNSVKVNGNAGMQLIMMADESQNPAQKTSYFQEAIRYLKKATEIHPQYVAGLLNLSLAQIEMNQLGDAEKNLNSVQALYPNHPLLPECKIRLSKKLYLSGLDFAGKGNIQEANRLILKSSLLAPNEAGVFFHLGATYYELGKYAEAKAAFKRTLEIQPDFPQARENLNALNALAP